MNILTVDTSTEAMRLYLSTEEATESRILNFGGMHSEHLVPEMLSMCKEAGLALKDLSLLVCTSGPGSFTGLRIGMSALKGIALAGSIPLVSIPTMEAIADAVSFFPGAVVPVIDARKKRYYSTIINEGKRLCPDLDCAGSEIAELLKGIPLTLVTGPDAEAFAPTITPYEGRLVVDAVRYRDIGPSLAKLGMKKFQEKGADDIGTGPVYIRKSDAEIALQKKMEAEANG